MSIPAYQFLMLPVLKAAAHGEVRISAVVDELANLLQLSSEERAELLPSGKQTVFSNRVHWAKSYLTKAQLIELTGQEFVVGGYIPSNLGLDSLVVGVYKGKELHYARTSVLASCPRQEGRSSARSSIWKQRNVRS